MASLASLRLAYSVRYASSYLKLRNQRSIMILSAHRLLPSMLCRIPLLRIKSMYFTHISACFTASNLISAQFKLSRHLTGSPDRIIRMQMVNDRFAFQFFLRNRESTVIHTGTIDSKQLCTGRNWQFFSRRKASD